MYDLTSSDVEILIECLKYSKYKIINSPDGTYEMRNEKLKRMDAAFHKLRSPALNQTPQTSAPNTNDEPQVERGIN